MGAKPVNTNQMGKWKRSRTPTNRNVSGLQFWDVFDMVVKSRLSWAPHHTIQFGDRLVKVLFFIESYVFCVQSWKSTQGFHKDSFLRGFAILRSRWLAQGAWNLGALNPRKQRTLGRRCYDILCIVNIPSIIWLIYNIILISPKSIMDSHNIP